MEQNILLVHGGGPTAVINASVYGVITEALESGRAGKVYGAIGGTEGVLKRRLLDLTRFDRSMLKRLLHTPASAIGSSRYPLEEKDYRDMINILKEYHIGYVLFNGGNGTMDTCGKLFEVCRQEDIKIAGIPKTIDNDISGIDHSPGFGSAARFLSRSVREICEDVRSLPIHVSVIEAMGRNAGWITASSALARQDSGAGPDLIYLPERPFRIDEFLEDVHKLWREKQEGVVVVVSEGLKDNSGNPVVPPVFQTGRSTYYGDVSSFLAENIIRSLGIKARSEKPGLLGRCSIALQSETDLKEAEWVGREAVKALFEGDNGIMTGICRKQSDKYEPYIVRVPLAQVSLKERTLPESFINERGNNVTQEFCDWCAPLAGEDWEPYLNFRDYI